LPVNNLREFVDYAKARPGQLNYGSGGSGTITHLSAALFVQRAGLEMTHVPYKGGGPPLADVVGGQIQLYSASPSEVIAFRGSNKVKLLGISSEKRNTRLPEVPAIAESYPGHVADTWNGLMAPAKTPPAVIERISRELQKAMSEPAFVERIEKMGLDPVRHTPQEFAESIRMQVNTWREVIRKAGIKPE
jgi:tripartite-type tricarboxylate transporter receptor subunit TctC